MESKVLQIIKIAQNFEDAIISQQITDFSENISMKASDIYYLLCQLMPDPKSIKWGDATVEWPGGNPNGA